MNAESLVQWTYAEPDVSAFLLERSVDAGATWPVKLPFNFNELSYIDADIELYGHYWYRVAGVNPKGTGSFSNLATVFFKPPDPQLFAWQNGAYTSATTLWNYLGPFSMSVSRSADGGATWPVTSVVTPTSQSTYYYIDNAASLGQTYIYRIKDMADPDLPTIMSDPITINAPTNVTTIAFTADSGFEHPFVTDVSWEHHTASLLDMNNQIRGRFSSSRMLLGGDDGYVGITTHQGYQGQCFSLLGPSESIWSVMGNHDVTDMGGIALWKNYFGTPTDYTRTQGPIQVFSLFTISEIDSTYTSGSPQWIALSQSLSASLNDPNIAWRIAMVHVPTVTSDFLHAPNTYLQAIPWRQWGVDVVLNGHNHIVERCESSSVAFITCGVGGSHKQGYPLGGISPYSKWIFIPIYDDTLSSVAWNSVNSYFAISDRNGYIYNSPEGFNWTLNTINPHISFGGFFYSYVVRMDYFASANKFLIVGSAPPT